MVIGIVVSVMEEEHRANREIKEPSLSELQQELSEIKKVLSELQNSH